MVGNNADELMSENGDEIALLLWGQTVQPMEALHIYNLSRLNLYVDFTTHSLQESMMRIGGCKKLSDVTSRSRFL